MIHPSAIIDPRAVIDPSVEIGPFTVIDAHVELGSGCVVGPHVHITGNTRVGEGNRFHSGCVIGDSPQDAKYAGGSTRLIVGNHNVFREHATVHRSNSTREDTVIGSNNFFMANSHVGHNASIGSHVVVANGALVAGHVTVGDRAFISGNCLIHQFVRVGALALMQGGAAISKDLPPFMIARGRNETSGLNIVGLRRAGFSAQERLELKRAYRLLQPQQPPLRLGQRLDRLASECQGPASQTLVEFIRQSRRGICWHASPARLREPPPESGDQA